MPWRIAELTSEHDSFIVRFSNGRFEIEVAADIIFAGRRSAVLYGLHMQGSGPNSIGPSVLY
jgi:hypothetical protein